MTRLPLAPLLLLLALTPTGCGEGPGQDAPSIVLVLIDTLRRDALPEWGGDAETPHLSALAAQGVAREALASFHQTSMSMGALFTGRTPGLESGDPPVSLAWQPASWCGMGRFSTHPAAGVCLPDGLPTLGERLAAQGYRTVGVVANALLHEPAGFARGFDHWVEVGTTPDPEERAFAKVHAALRDVLAALPGGAASDPPLFLYVHYLDVHDWLYRSMSYREAVEEMDRGIGELLRILEANGLGDAVRLIVSDHGELVGDRERVLPHHPLHFGNPSYRDVLDVPFVLVGAPPRFPLPERIRSEDVHRILLALAGAPIPRESDLAADELYVSELHFRTYQRGRFKSLWARDPEARFVLVDLAEDPGETQDAAARHPDTARAHRARVAELSATLAAPDLPTNAAPLDPEWVERLRGLGYLP